MLFERSVCLELLYLHPNCEEGVSHACLLLGGV